MKKITGYLIFIAFFIASIMSGYGIKCVSNQFLSDLPPFAEIICFILLEVVSLGAVLYLMLKAIKYQRVKNKLDELEDEKGINGTEK